MSGASGYRVILHYTTWSIPREEKRKYVQYILVYTRHYYLGGYIQYRYVAPSSYLLVVEQVDLGEGQTSVNPVRVNFCLLLFATPAIF